MKQLEGKVAIITGSAQGIGKAIAEKYVAEGATVAVVDINLEKAAATAAELKAASGLDCQAFKADVTNMESIQECVAAVKAAYGKIDILVNNAGVQPPKEKFWEVSKKTLDFSFDVNLKSVYMFSQAVIPTFLEQPTKGTIVSTSSVAGDFLWDGSCSYIACKAAIRDLTKAMAFELAPYGIRVNCVAPGHVNTELNAQLLSDPESARRTNAQVPMRRVAETSELAGAFVFLAKDESSYVTGTCLYVDGGLAQVNR